MQGKSVTPNPGEGPTVRVQDCLFNVQRPCYSVMQEPLESAMSHAGMGRSQGTCQCKAQQAQSRDVFLCFNWRIQINSFHLHSLNSRNP